MKEVTNWVGVIFTTVSIICVVGIGIFYVSKQSSISDVKNVVKERLTRGIVEVKKEVTKEEKVLDAVNFNRSRVVGIYKYSQEGVDSVRELDFLTKGIIYSTKGAVIAVKGDLQDGVDYLISIPGQKEIIKVQPVKVGGQFVLFEMNIATPLVTKVSKRKLSKGDMVVAIGGKQEDTMATGEVFMIDGSTEDVFIITTILKSGVELGAPLLNTEQQVVGLCVGGSADNKAVFVTVDNIDNDIKKIKK